MSASPADRKAELERKKQRLAAIREEKRRREEARRRQLLEGKDPGTDAGDHSPARNSDVRQEAANILKDLEDSGFIPPSSGSPHSGNSSLNTSAVSGDETFAKEGSPAQMIYKSRGMVNLQKAETIQVNFPPKEQVLYAKGTQTNCERAESEAHAVHSFEWDDEFSGHGLPTPEDVFDFEGSPPPGFSRLPHIELIRPTEVTTEKEKEEKPVVRDLSDEERQRVMQLEDFQKFFDRSSRIMERALTEDVDIFVDYSRGPEDTDKGDSGALLSLNRSFYDEKWSKGRCVSCLDSSLQHPELVATSYLNNSDSPHDPDGVVLIWNAKFKKDTPEYVFHCRSRVVSVTFAKFHPNLILGGTYSGQICLWDNRCNKKTPVQKSPLQTQAHTHPVYCMKVVGTQNAHNLVSVSSDGKLCSWSLDMLSQPQDTLELQLKQSKQVAVTSVSFPANDVNNFVVGSEDGTVYMASRHGSKQGIGDSYEGHFGPITGIHCHAAVGPVDFSHLFLSASFDWTVKLWSLKDSKPLYSFEDHQDYVMDVAWSPAHPALFACIDATGRLDLWNLNKDTEVPAASVYVEGKPALNKLMWMPNGTEICVGDDNGRVWLYDVAESVSVSKIDDWTKLARALLEIQQSNTEAEELAHTMSSTTTTMR